MDNDDNSAPVEPDRQAAMREWEARLKELAAERDMSQIRLPNPDGKRVSREKIAEAFVTSFELIGGVPRLAYWADENYGEFVKIFSRLLPKEVTQVHDGKVEISHKIAPSALDQEDGQHGSSSGSTGRVVAFPTDTPEG